MMRAPLHAALVVLANASALAAPTARQPATAG
jgi:hypothetical protein